jgi:hypothetical protein
MKIIYSNEFLRKSTIPHYPIKGYWYIKGWSNEVKDQDLINKIENNNQEVGTILRNIFNSGLSNLSVPKAGSTLITNYNDETKVKSCKLSLTYDQKEDRNKEFNIIFLVFIDKVRTSEDKLSNLTFDDVAGVLVYDSSSDLDRYNVNLIDLQYVPTCSFECNGIEASLHYSSDELDIVPLYKADTDPTSFIEFNSGDDYLRGLRGDTRPEGLNGHLTVTTSGVIKL